MARKQASLTSMQANSVQLQDAEALSASDPEMCTPGDDLVMTKDPCRADAIVWPTYIYGGPEKRTHSM